MDEPQSKANGKLQNLEKKDVSVSTAPLLLPAKSPPSFSDFIQKIFVGSEGVRWIWRLLFYFGIRKVFFVVLSVLPYYADQSGVLSLWVTFVAEITFLLAAFLPVFFFALVEGRSFADYGFPPRVAFGKMFWSGAAWGLGAITLLMLALYGTGAFSFGGFALHGPRILKLAIFWGVFFLLVGVAEEFYLRGYPLFTLAGGIGFWPAAVVLSTAFAIIHIDNPGETTAGLIGAGFIGLFFCLTVRRTGSLWFAIGFHAAWDWGESYLYSVPDSGGVAPGRLLNSSLHGPAWLTGGTVGPEGSIFLFVLVVGLWIAFHRLYPEVKYGERKERGMGGTHPSACDYHE